MAGKESLNGLLDVDGNDASAKRTGVKVIVVGAGMSRASALPRIQALVTFWLASGDLRS